MKKFLVRLFIFLTPVIIVIGLWEYGLSKIQNSYSLKRAQLEAQAPKIEVLVLGGSFTLRGVNPDYFNMKGYNAANVEQSIFYDTRIALKYLDEMTSLKVVLISVSYNTMWWQTCDGKEPFRDYFYADYWGIRYPAIKWYDINIYSRILQYGNFTAFQMALRKFQVNLVQDYRDNGWAPKMRETLPINDSIGLAMAMDRKKEFKRENLDSNIHDLTHLLEELKKHKISAVFYTPPVTTSNYKFMEQNRLKTMDSVMTNLCNAYNCKWYDYHKDSRFTDTDFKDVGHLNPDGATKFSEIINEEILEKYSNPQTN